MNPPEPFVWSQRDASLVECTDCNEVIEVGVMDLHRC